MKIKLEIEMIIEKFHPSCPEIGKIDISFFEEIVKNKLNQQRTMHTMPFSFWNTLTLKRIIWD
jgi:hypothetical protein